MPNTKKLLSITNIKKYFPVGKSSLFERQKRYVRANEDISIDIYEGETIGVVGESGCGKSTLGRVLLQLYPPTAGSVMYYGSTLAEISPRYVQDTLRHIDRYREKYKKAQERTAELNARIEAVGGDENADFYLLQDRNLARCEEQTCLNNMVKIMGGFFAVDEGGKGRDLILRIHEENTRCAKLEAQRVKLNTEHGPGAERKLARLSSEIAAVKEVISKLSSSLNDLSLSLASDPEFAKYEAMRDNGIDLARLRYSEQRSLRKDLQIIFQDPYSSLNPRFTVGQIIEEGLLTHHYFEHGTQEMHDYIVQTMEKCGLQEYMLHRYPHQFSGGQRQRICIARALAVNPKFIVCDECVSALDVSIQSQIINLLQELKEQENLTYMFISHDLSVVRYISDRICVMYLGNVVEFADTETIFHDPRHPYIVALLSSIPTTDPESLEKERILLEGSIPSPIKPPSGCKFHTRCYMATEKCKRIPPELREIEPGHFLACHFPERKIDEKGNYLFQMPKTERKSTRVRVIR